MTPRGVRLIVALAALALSSACKLDTLVYGGKKLDAYVLPPTAVPDSLRAEVTFASGGETLHGFWLRQPGAAPRVTVLFSHGKGANLARVIEWSHAEGLWAAGFDVLVYDYRGFGRSTGTSTDETTLIADGMAAYQWVLQQPGVTPARVVSYGHSLGSVPATALAAATPGLRALVIESGFASGHAMGESANPLGMPVEWLLRGPMDNLRRIATVAAPVLIVHGSADAQIPVAQAHDLFAAAHAGAQLQIVPGAAHDDVPQVLGATAYRALIRTFTNAAVP
ncbi:MAG: alpha/beta hydrolase [Gemmatimonadetes bacterium]|nr:alpha/beta hydrolase [Gemmatimonadota bacterium]